MKDFAKKGFWGTVLPKMIFYNQVVYFRNIMTKILKKQILPTVTYIHSGF